MAEVADNDGSKRNRRKRKSFFQNAKGFAKKGCFGRGSTVEQEVYNYFLNIIQILRNEETPTPLEDKLILASNSLEERLEEVLTLASNQVCSRALEGLIPFTPPEMFESIMASFSKDFRVVCSDQYASHILEKILEVCLLRTTKSSNEDIKVDEISHNLNFSWPEEHRETCQSFITRTSNFMLNNLEDFYEDLYANHVTRRCILSLTGLVPTSKLKKPQKEEFLTLQVEESGSLVKEFAERLQCWPQFKDLPYGELTSGLLQTLCTALKHTDKNVLKSFGKKILHEAFLASEKEEDKEDEIALPKVFTTEPSIRLLETLLTVAGPKLMTQLNAMLFCGRLKPLTVHKSANFAVQKLLANVKEEKEFEALFDEVSPLFEEVLALGFTGVVLATAQACERLKVRQGQFVQSLQKTLNCEKTPPVSFFVCVSKLKPSNACVSDNSNFVHLHGSLVIQAILNFNKPIKFIQGMLEVKVGTLLTIFTDPKGSHIVDSFFQSKSVGEQSKVKFLKLFEGFFVKFAVSKHGSQALEAMFNAVPPKHRTLILDELAESFNQLNGSPIGRIVSKKLCVEVYKQNPKRWEAAFEKATKEGVKTS